MPPGQLQQSSPFRWKHNIAAARDFLIFSNVAKSKSLIASALASLGATIIEKLFERGCEQVLRQDLGR